MSTIAELERRVATLERELVAARRLADSAIEDAKDVKSALQSQTKVLNGWGFQVNSRLDAIEDKANRHDERLERIETTLDTVVTGQQQILTMLTQLTGSADSAPPG